MVFADQPAVPSHSQSLEQLKSKLTERLAKLEVMAGVLPTPVARSQLMRDTCDKIGALPYIDGRNVRFGHGRVNAEAAVLEAIELAPNA